MTILTFELNLHGWCRVGASYGREGVDAAIDPEEPIGADHLKGLMLAAARDTLAIPAGVVGEVFGSSSTPSPWVWTAAAPAGPRARWTMSHRHRVAIDEGTHSAVVDALVFAEQTWVEQAAFGVWLAGSLPAESQGTHELLLRASAAAVHGLGAWRRRGLGWVGIAPTPAIGDDDVSRLLQLRAAT